MTAGDTRLELVLELARRAGEPHAGEARRVLHAVRGKIQRDGASALRGREGSGARPTPAAERSPGRACAAWSACAWGARRLLRWRARGTWLVCVSIATGALGSWLGSRTSPGAAAHDAGAKPPCPGLLDAAATLP